MSELQTKINTAIERLKAFEPADEPYYLCFSGGKDSDCIRILADLAGVKHDIVHNLTTVDAPETVRYIKSIPNVQIKMPKYSMWQLIEKKKRKFSNTFSGYFFPALLLHIIKFSLYGKVFSFSHS